MTNPPSVTYKPSPILPDPHLVEYPLFEGVPPPSDAEGWIARAHQVGEALHLDEKARDTAHSVPYRQVQYLKESGLVTLLGPVEAGGAGETWSTAYRVIRAVARGDGSLGQLLGYHYLWFWTIYLLATPDQVTRLLHQYTASKAFFGGAVNPRDSDLKVTEEAQGRSLVFDGRKFFATGSKVSDVTILEGVLPDGSHVFAPAPSKQPGIVFGDDWVDTLGMRGTQSGGVLIKQVEVPWGDALGYDNKHFVPLGAVNTLVLPAIQLVFTSFYLGITEGALSRGLEYTSSQTRSWPYVPAGRQPEAGRDEFYIQEGYGALQAAVWGVEAQVDVVVDQISDLLHRPLDRRSEIPPQDRAHIAVRIAAAKLRAAKVGLEVTSKVFELQGARSIAGKLGYDVAWRDLRTHTLHDPIAHKKSEVGRYALAGGQAAGWPEPTWYT